MDTLKFGLGLALALLFASPAAIATEAQDCSHLIIVGDNPDTTLLTGTTSQVATYVSADQNIRLNAGGGAWAIGTADEVEWCWTSDDVNIDPSRAFKVSLSVTLSSDATSANVNAAIGKDTTSGIAAGDEVGVIPSTELIIAADFANISSTEYVTVSSGECIGVILGNDVADKTITVGHFTLEAEQLICSR